ncbi:hypothetical protein SAMN05216188_14312 [Lentzea xinjiangensis]|uniref:ABC-2 type transport system permease protein n=1 Tax=Lentzea xinjiangensis TaxID=402600 RepID=A0A1H9WTM8_9PSEU|nr:hypothetical protein [Lentzea xinjiangensis]SES37300.1 hypothetical protein SAMN05216188_14312 [Lentzea xinjiangensis]
MAGERSVTSLVSLLVIGPQLGAQLPWWRVPLLALLVVLTAFSVYCVGVALGAVVLAASSLRNIFSNAAYLLVMAGCGFVVPTSFWPSWLGDVTSHPSDPRTGRCPRPLRGTTLLGGPRERGHGSRHRRPLAGGGASGLAALVAETNEWPDHAFDELVATSPLALLCARRGFDAVGLAAASGSLPAASPRSCWERT